MLTIILGALPYVFPLGRAADLIKAGHKVTESSNPLILTKNVTLTVIKYFSKETLLIACITSSLIFKIINIFIR